MRSSARGLAATLAFLLLSTPCFADLLGSRLGEDPQKDRARVVERLGHLGVSSSTADKEASELSARDLEYFASNPGRLTLAGAQEGGGQGEFLSGSSHVMWYELVGGIAFFALGLGIIFHALTQSEK